MLEEALAGECVFAVGRMKDGKETADVGTAGLVRASRQGEDGTSQLLLHGVIRVRFLEWMAEKPYPYALIEPIMCRQLEERKGLAAMRTLRGAVEDGIAGLPDEVREGVMRLLEEADEAALMTDLVAQQFVHDADLRQRLLKTECVGERVRMLCEFFESLRKGDG